ncbi:hypothetical protein A2331_06355 [Candidatus Falkowbacteria bacterium RIFOXYB2_FULL_34_18]|uniref:Uncharacterized protein n=1 Tax=Candidatus Falkowbacteria bacterium RIFOXYD2_FULL_34_120 TaxID=1798007 RepID=A0A1F5TQD2_9BACT|nr:MAG: hypothetical protein A2331_06355 [Candidatus Falkowbacteria bacterium RIFOXYB2_FULL_34_18]OGF29391.1 MAG: hypothetical protein A2500_06445 [Candidatus Falkowbacteria bacterium RIFOXYC12_FULL_34_55]OGF36600.1 MAG: hypothetical protein A2466_06780 [Candidatus Falkowbacteria bacterium RIFOXYC2_FULL_34_220]OGF38818.1 MAG: hypothetical protein A2515_03225 [Candidatus Falkowbacteria bacterium RIFOXYD12_FULL_34_57]OGF41077.1 MAG: hypothetical protein A2531_03270 [Candidatus Falkowbacteria bact
MKKPTLLKSFVYLINDISNILLEKERQKDDEAVEKIHKILIFVVFLLLISIGLNIYLLYIK